MKYTPPTAEQMRELKESAAATAKKMAERTCVTEQHWRKFTASTVPRGIPYEKLFHFAALELLSEDQIHSIHQFMVRIGAVIEANELNNPNLLALRLKAQEAADNHMKIIDQQTDVLRQFPGSTPLSPNATSELNVLATKEREASKIFRILEQAYIDAGGTHPFYVQSRHHINR